MLKEFVLGNIKSMKTREEGVLSISYGGRVFKPSVFKVSRKKIIINHTFEASINDAMDRRLMNMNLKEESELNTFVLLQYLFDNNFNYKTVSKIIYPEHPSGYLESIILNTDSKLFNPFLEYLVEYTKKIIGKKYNRNKVNIEQKIRKVKSPKQGAEKTAVKRKSYTRTVINARVDPSTIPSEQEAEEALIRHDWDRFDASYDLFPDKSESYFYQIYLNPLSVFFSKRLKEIQHKNYLKIRKEKQTIPTEELLRLLRNNDWSGRKASIFLGLDPRYLQIIYLTVGGQKYNEEVRIEYEKHSPHKRKNFSLIEQEEPNNEKRS